MAEKALTFEELAGELRELASRVVALDIRDQSAAVVLQGEGQFGDSEDDPGSWSFQVGGYAPPERDGIRFIVASWLTVCIDKEHVAEAHDISTGIGVPITIRVRTTGRADRHGLAGHAGGATVD